MINFLKKFLSYLLPDEESNISFFNWFFRLFLVLSALILSVVILINSVKDTDFGKDYGLITNISQAYTSGNSSLIAYSRLNKDIWLKFKELKDKYENFYFAYIIQFYDVYTNEFVTGLSNKEVQIFSWIEPQNGSIIDFTGLEEVINRRAVEIRSEGFNDDGCNNFSIDEKFYPFLRGTFTNFRDKEEILDVSVCPIKNNRSNEVFALTALYYRKGANYKQLEAAFRSVTNSIELSLQPFM